ncbi:CAP domain-containing protein [Neobacillus sp. NPDC093127]|uniref:CAP domain-containing protein n=1 Tax=Neobacillus sp. NPDC093127 TaxID=3364296 RepID=UPI003824B5C4
MLKNKAILTVAAAAALVTAGPVMNKAHAATNSPSVHERVYVYQGADMNEINSIIEKYMTSLGFSTAHNTVKQPVLNQTYQTQQPSQSVAAKPVPQQSTTAQQIKTTQSTSAISAQEQKVVDLTNQERAKNGLPALKVDLTLSKMAHEKSRDMSANGYFSHTSPTYGSPFDMMKKYGITYRYAGENIAMGQRTPEEVVKAWMNSEGHRKNILNPNYNYIGVGYVSQGNYWTQEFIGK